MKINQENDKYILTGNKNEINRLAHTLQYKCRINSSYYSAGEIEDHKAWTSDLLNRISEHTTLDKKDLIYLSCSFNWTEAKTEDEINYRMSVWDMVDNAILGENLNAHRKMYDQSLKRIVEVFKRGNEGMTLK